MESKTFCLGEHFTSYDDIKEKMRKYEKENFVNLWVRDSRAIEAARVKKDYNPAIQLYEVRYACNVNMVERILKVRVLERGHRRKSFFHWFYNCL